MKVFSSLLLLLQFSASYAHGPTVEERSLASEIWAEIESAATCAGCDAILELLKGLANLGTSLFVDTITEICKISGADDDDVCEGAVGLEGPILAADLKAMKISSHTSQLFCTTFFGLCDYPAVTPYNLNLSTKPATSRPVTSGQTPLQVVHFSDIHVDHSYETGANYNCTKPTCCRPFTTADSPGNNDFPAGPYGNPKCDSPVSLVESMYAAIKSIAPEASFSLFTGDIVDHAVWLDNSTGNIFDINDAYSRMTGLPTVYGVVGNHEAAPCNAFPPTALTSASSTQQWIYNTLSAAWTQWIGATVASTSQSFGGYSVLSPGANLRIISVNTNLYYRENYYLYEPSMEADPSGQLAWLISELAAAEAAGERVYIIGHMPMGSSDTFRDGSNYFDQIVNRYSSTIAALFFGHTHKDEFEIAYNDYTAQSFSNALEISYIAPSLEPGTGNPSFRVYSVDPVTYAVLDFQEYIADMSNPDFQTTGPVWTPYYSAKATYGPLLTPPLTDPTAELTPAFWHNVTVVFEDDDAAFQAYYIRKYRGTYDTTCTGTCKTDEICQIRAAQSQYNCGTITPGISFKKRDERGVFERSAAGVIEPSVCEGSLLRPILARIVAEDGLLERAVEMAKAKAEAKK